MLNFSIIFLSIVLASCASSPDKMTASYVSPLQYHDYSCKQIAMEAATVERKVAELYGTLDKTASNDAMQMGVGLVLFWPTLFFLEGGDGAQATEYKYLKGQYEALEKIAIQKKCSYEFKAYKPPEPEKKKKESKLNDS